MTEMNAEDIYLVMHKPLIELEFNDEDFDPYWYFTNEEEAQKRINDTRYIDEKFRSRYYVITLEQFLDNVDALKCDYDDKVDVNES